MVAYMVVACKIKDRDKFIAGYGKAVPELVDKFGGEYVFVAPGATMLEGHLLAGYTSLAISKWPSREVALSFWNSDNYTEVKKLREGLADAEVLLIEVP